MSLMHPRVANNYAKMGYYPTDEKTMDGITYLLRNSSEPLNCLDPSSGCGQALSQLCSLIYPGAVTYGIELDPERAEGSKRYLNHVLTGSALDSHVTPGSIDLLFMNPPYGLDLNDSDVMNRSEGSKMIEHVFLKQFFSCLSAEGIMIYIIPKLSFNRSIQKWMQYHFSDIRVFKAGVDRFKQIVIIARKRARQTTQLDESLMEYWESCHDNDDWNSLPYERNQECYLVQACGKTVRIFSKSLDKEGLLDVKEKYLGLWSQFKQMFHPNYQDMAIRPIHDLTDWHTCLLITSGVVNGLIDNGERRLLIKGHTHKIKKVVRTVDEEGDITQEEHRERFETLIKAIDLSKGSDNYGNIVIIK